MHKHAIVMVGKGHVMPRPFAEGVLAKYPTSAGVGIILNGELVVNISATPGQMTVDKLLKTCEKYKEHGLVFSFGDYPEGFLSQDAQPYVVLKDQGKNQLISFVAGQYPGFVKAGTVESPERRFSEIFLTTKIAELYEIGDNKLENLLKSLQKPVIKNEMTMAAIGDSQVVLMARTGEVMVYPKDHTCRPKESSWGWWTDPMLTDEVPEVVEEPVVEEIVHEASPTTQPNIFDDEEEVVKPKPAATGKKPPVIASTEPLKQPAPDKLDKVINHLKTTTAMPKPKVGVLQSDSRGIVEMRENGEVWYTPNKALHGKPLKHGYRACAGFLPNGTHGTDEHYANHPAVKVADKKLSDYLGKAMASAVGSAAPEKPSTVPTPATPVAVPAPSPVPAPARTAPTELPVLTPAAVEGVRKKLIDPVVKKAIDDHSNDIVDPKVLSQYEKKFPTAMEAIGAKGGLSAVVRWPYEVLREFCQNHPDFAALLMMDLRAHWLLALDHAELETILKIEDTPKEQERDLSSLPPAVRKRIEAKRLAAAS